MRLDGSRCTHWRLSRLQSAGPFSSQGKGGNGHRSGYNVRKGSVYGLDQFLLDTGYWIGCVLDRVGLTGRQAVEELDGGFGASVGGSERTLERVCVLDAMAYAIDWRRTERDRLMSRMAVRRTDWIEGCGADCVLTDPGVIRDWFWGAKHG
ncbi:hypothetical protein DY000_02024847 [Brassica cretica]|uniref:Uncharacterized protein n=1 Tax=Brassica cretica TaxID=69181 RepID=A0ABQ7E535_BRACR|nr:hypothetical protein DY000_02024847 [Brassica cretica]